MAEKIKIVVGIGGASGAVYSKVLLDKLTLLHAQTAAVGVVMTENAKINWQLELGEDSYNSYPFTFYKQSDFMAPFASGSARFGVMVVCPCSMGMMARIAGGISNDLMSRAADVVLKERRRLILVPRDTPYSLIHINNMKAITEAGGVICPASPSFYSQPKTVEAVVATVVDRVLDLAGFDIESFRWGDG